MSGLRGFENAYKSLWQVADQIDSGRQNSKLTIKYDGSPAIIYGMNENNFFISTKAALAKDSRIAYNNVDLHNLCESQPDNDLLFKLREAFEHLPKIMPYQGGIYHSDLLFSSVGRIVRNSEISFQPNPRGIKYFAYGERAEKIKQAKIGIVSHMRYIRGNGLFNPSSDVPYDEFKKHPDVFHIDPRYPCYKVVIDDQHRREFTTHMNTALSIHLREDAEDMYSAIVFHGGYDNLLMRFMNYCVRGDMDPTVPNYRQFLEEKFHKDRQKAKLSKTTKMIWDRQYAALQTVTDKEVHFEMFFLMIKHLQQAKNVLIRVLNKHQEFVHSFGNTTTQPEGYVCHNSEVSSKFVMRHEFSKRNLTK